MKEKLWTSNFLKACFANFLMGFAFYLIGTTMPFYIGEKYGATEAETGLILASYIIATLLVRPFSGYIVDSYSRKKVYIIAYVFFVFVYFGYMWASTIALFVLARMMHGITWSVITTSSSTVAIDIIPSERRGEGIGFFGLTTTVAMSIGPFIGLYLYEKYPFEYNFYSTIIVGILGLLTALTIKVPKRGTRKKEVLSLDRFILKPAVPIGINVLFISISYGMLFTYAAKFGLHELKISSTGFFFLFMAIGMAASRLFAGRLLDLGYVNQLMLASLLIIGLGYTAFGLATSEMLYFGSAIFIGLGYGMASPSFQTMIINVGTNDQRGTANSTFFTFYDLGIGIGMVISGFLATVLPSFGNLFVIGGVLAFVGLLYYYFVSKKVYASKKII